MSKKVFTRPNGRRDVSQFQRQSGHSFSYTFSGMPDDASPSKRGSGSETRREEKPSKMTGFFRWLGGLVSIPQPEKSAIPNYGQTLPPQR